MKQALKARGGGDSAFLPERGAAGAADRALDVVEEALPDRHAVARLVIDLLEADPFADRQAMEIDVHVAVDVAEAVLAAIGERTGEVGRQRDARERRERRAFDERAGLGQPRAAPRAAGAEP